MQVFENFSLKNYNTFGIEVKSDFFVEYSSVEELKTLLCSDLIKNHQMLHIGSGSNLLFLKDFHGVILHSAIQYFKVISESNNLIYLEVGAGVVWDSFVAYCVNLGLGGAENLSLIPGEVGASAVQNIGAYGVEVKDLIDKVFAVEIATGKTFVFDNAACEYDYRKSVFKTRLKDQFIVTSVVFKLQNHPDFKLTYQHLEAAVLKNGAVTLANIRRTIIAVRESKLPDPKMLGNAGSFFMNPVIDKLHFDQLLALYPEMPHYHLTENLKKIPAAWLIDQCGWKGRSIGHAAVHDKQALVLVNRGLATGKEIAALAHEIQKSVNERFSIQLIPEVIFVG